jgi:hypothetical protein
MQKANYSIELKELVNALLDADPFKRPTANFLVTKVKEKKTMLN